MADVPVVIKARADTAVTAERIRVTVQPIHHNAIRNLRMTTNPAHPLRGATACAPVEPHRYLGEKDLGAFWSELDDQREHIMTVTATKLLMLTMIRRIGLLRSKWPRSDLDAAQWGIRPLSHFFKRINFGAPDITPHHPTWDARHRRVATARARFGRDVVELLPARSD